MLKAKVQFHQVWLFHCHLPKPNDHPDAQSYEALQVGLQFSVNFKMKTLKAQNFFHFNKWNYETIMTKSTYQWSWYLLGVLIKNWRFEFHMLVHSSYNDTLFALLQSQYCTNWNICKHYKQLTNYSTLKCLSDIYVTQNSTNL